MIYYIGYYEETDGKYTRQVFPAALNKMKYIVHAMNCDEMDVQVVSCSMSTDTRGFAASNQRISEKTALRLFRTFGRKNIVTRILDKLGRTGQLVTYLFKNVKENDVVVIYHTPAYCDVLRWLFKIKRAYVILEMEELYSDVLNDPELKKRELAIADAADGFIFPTQLLNDAVNTENKPFAIVHGTYQVEPDRKHRFDDGKIHVVYAGTLDPRKGGAAAAAAAQYLSENYHVHILGFGSEKEINDMKKLTQEISGKGMAAVTYDGLLSGEEYIRFIQACDIGLSTQNPDAAFNATSFPSKVLSYMANGLRVVSVRIEAIEVSAVGDLITYYEEQTPENIAKAIMSVDVSQPYDSRKRIAELDEQFQKDLKQLIEAK